MSKLLLAGSRERVVVREQALRECFVCQRQPKLWQGGSPHKVVVVCPGCWDCVESLWQESEGIDHVVSDWNQRQARRSGVEVQHCGTCGWWGDLREREDRRRCFRQGRKYWEMRTSRHMGLECPDYLVQIGREGER